MKPSVQVGEWHFFALLRMLYRQTTLNCRGTIVDLQYPIIMGVINATPDSFYAESRTKSIDQILAKVDEMRNDGASIIDIGAMSSRPGAHIISPEEEIERLRSLLPTLTSTFPAQIFSIDTVWSKVARFALDQGVHMINDISAGTIDPSLIDILAIERDVPYVLMHMQGDLHTMQHNPSYQDIALEVLDFLIDKLGMLVEKGIFDVIVDPGFGFGKDLDHNYELLRKLHVLKIMERPILVGVSRKSMIYKALGVSASAALNGTSALHMVALQQGAQILRAHDVREAKQCVVLAQRLWPPDTWKTLDNRSG